MIDLTGKEKFVGDLEFANTSVHPVIVIESDPPIYLSQNEEVISVDGEQILFNSLNLNIPSIKESLDLENRKITTSNITLTLSNYTNFSDMFSYSLLIGSRCSVYWRSPSCSSLSDCLLIYRAFVKRVDHDLTTVKIMLEDTTDKTFHRKIPTAILPQENSPLEDSADIRIPFSYGEVDKAPCILWENEGDPHMYVLSDDMFDVEGRNISLNSNPSNLNMYQGGYGKVLDIQEHWFEMAEGVSDGRQIEYDSFGAKIAFNYSDVGSAESPATYNYLQAMFSRKATSVKLLDGTEELDINSSYIARYNPRTYQGMASEHNFLGEEDGYYISNEKNIFERKKVSYNGQTYEELFQDTSSFAFSSSYASLPAFEVGSIEDFQTYVYETIEGGEYLTEVFLKKEDFKPQKQYYPNYVDINDIFVRSYKLSTLRLFENLDDAAEFIFLPPPHIIHGLFSNWYAINGTEGWQVMAWDDPSPSNHHMWGHCWTWEDCRDTMNYESSVIEFQNNATQPTDEEDLYYNIDTEFPRPLFRFTLVNAETGETSDSGFVTFANTPNLADTANFHSYQLNGGNIEPPFADIEFWVLIKDWSDYSYGGIDGQDMPRFHAISKTSTSSLDYDDLGIEDNNENLADWATGFVNFTYDVGWNGVTTDIYGDSNTFPSGGYSSASGKKYVPWKGKNYENWLEFFNHSYFGMSPWVLMKENKVMADSTEFTKGCLIPTSAYTSFFNEAAADAYFQEIQSHGYSSFHVDVSNNSLWSGFGSYEGAFIPFSETYVPLRCNDGNLNTGSVDKIGMIFTFEDVSPSDIMPSAGVTSIEPAINIDYAPNSIDEGWASQDNLNWTGAIQHLMGFAQIEGITQNYTNWYDEDLDISYFESMPQVSYFHSLVSNQSNEGYYSSSMFPSTDTEYWENPNQYNSIAIQIGTIRSNLAGETYDLNPNALVNLKIYGFNVNHYLNIINIKDKIYTLHTNGRFIPSVSNESSAYMDTPSYIVTDIIQRELVQSVQVDSTRDNYTIHNWKLAFSVKESIDSKKLIEDICKSTPCITRLKSDGALSFTYIKNEYQESDVNFIVNSLDVIKISFSRTKLENVKTLVRVFYEKDYNTDEYKQSTYYSDAYDFYGNGDFMNVNYQLPTLQSTYRKIYYGLDPNNPADSILEFKSDYIRSSYVANKLRNFLVGYHCNQHNILNIKLPIKYVAIEIGDIIKLDELVDGKLCFGENYSMETTRNGQEIYPYFIVTSVNKSIKSIDISCEQLHNLLPKTSPYMIRNEGSGNVLRTSPRNPTEEDVLALTEYLDGGNPYFTETQMANSDLNSNYSVDEGDLALLIEEVAGFNWESVVDEMSDEYNSSHIYDFRTQLESHSYNLNNGIMRDDNLHNDMYNFLIIDYPTEGSGTDFLTDMSVFYDNSQVWNADNSHPFVGWYIKVSNEWIYITNDITYYNDIGVTSHTTLTVERGALNTEVTAHSAGEEVLIFFDYPTAQLELDSLEEELTDYNEDEVTEVVMQEPLSNLAYLFDYGSALGGGIPAWLKDNIAVGEFENSDNLAAYIRNSVGAVVTWANNSNTVSYMSTGISPHWLSDNNNIDEAILQNDSFIFQYGGEKVGQGMDDGQIVSIASPEVHTQQNSFDNAVSIGSYRGFEFSGFVILKDNISQNASYNIALNDPLHPDGIKVNGTHNFKLDKNGNNAFYMTVRLEDFVDASGAFRPMAGQRYIFIESKLYGGQGAAEAGWHNPQDLPSDSSSYYYDAAEVIEIYKVYGYDYMHNSGNEEHSAARRGTVQILRHMAHVDANEENGYSSWGNELVASWGNPNSPVELYADDITNHVEGAHFCGNNYNYMKLGHLLLHITP